MVEYNKDRNKRKVKKMNNKLEKLFKEKNNQEDLRTINIKYLKKIVEEASTSDFLKDSFCAEIRSIVRNIQSQNEILEEIYSEIEKNYKPKM